MCTTYPHCRAHAYLLQKYTFSARAYEKLRLHIMPFIAQSCMQPITNFAKCVFSVLLHLETVLRKNATVFSENNAPIKNLHFENSVRNIAIFCRKCHKLIRFYVSENLRNLPILHKMIGAPIPLMAHTQPPNHVPQRRDMFCVNGVTYTRVRRFFRRTTNADPQNFCARKIRRTANGVR